jgi:phage protein D
MRLSNPRAIIQIDGIGFDSYQQKSLFSALRVERTTNQASQAELSVIDDDFTMLDSFSTANGIPLAEAFVWLGYGDEMGDPVFEGLLTAVSRGNHKSNFKFLDRSFQMRREQKTEYHHGTAVAIIRKLALRNGLEFAGPGSGFKDITLRSQKQEAQTDWDLANRLANDAGLVLFVRGATLFAKLPARTGTPALTLARHDVLALRGSDYQFKLPENREGRPGTLEVRGRGRGGKRLTGRAEKNKRGHKRILIHHSLKNLSASEANSRAHARKELLREHAFSCRVRSLFSSEQRVDVRDTVELVDQGLLFSGLYLVDSLEHAFEASPGSLQTAMDLYRDVKEN